ncbi:hypothetical protein BKA64DRAFT_712384 [Cadophora sp. MPI-SDFR-AT-0126]|nr:hypothetical protein BKA64DRAFT_712384 [Leotiomycetes sp. MPI-SDFR-AT-0126]
MSEKVVHFHQSKETRDILHWFEPVNPTLRHQGFREDHQQGSGYWLFDTPEYSTWISTKNSALWIYGIPGAGKTILASLVIETLSSSKSNGLAYFYIRYNDIDSQRPAHILGSLVSQLCRQNPAAFRDVIEFYASYHTTGGVPKRPTVRELGILLQRLSLHFDSPVSVVVDGLDEVGAALEAERISLIRVISTLHQGSSNIRIVVFSRVEADIKHHLSEFSQISVAARSSDIQLYVAARIHKLQLEDDGLKVEVLEALVNNADGMFFQTVCHVQLLQTPASPASIREELASLPIGLSATYCRMFERIEADYHNKIRLFIQRALNWLVWGPPLQMEEFVHMICMHDEIQVLRPEDVPEPDSVIKWLGCLVRLNGRNLELAHFSIKEFLLNSQASPSQSSASNPFVQKYLMPETKRFGPALACFSYLSLSTVIQTPFDLFDTAAMEAFTKRFPFYHHAATHVVEHAAAYDPQDERPQFQRLFNNSAPQFLWFWIQYVARFRRGGPDRPGSQGWTVSERSGDASERTAPLHVACELRLTETVSRLLSEGADPNLQSARYSTPLHRVVDPASGSPLCYKESAHLYYVYDYSVDPRTLKIIKLLLDGKADVNLTSRYADSRMLGRKSKHHSYCSPLYIAIWYRLQHVCQILLDYGALLIADLPAMRRLAANFELDHTKGLGGAWVDIFDRVLRQGTYEPEVQAILKALRVKATPTRLENTPWPDFSGLAKVTDCFDLKDTPQKLNKGFLLAVKECNPDLAAYYLAKGGELSVKDENHRNALVIASQAHPRPSSEIIRMIKDLEKAGANLAATHRGRNAVHYAMTNGDIATIEYLESRGVDIDTEDRVGERPLHLAIHQHFEAGLDFVLRKKLLADTINRASDHCGTPLYCAAKEGNINISEKLLCAGAMVNAVALPGNILGPALYVACAEGHAKLVRVLLSHGAEMKMKTSRYGSAMEVAKAFEQKEVMEVLENYGRSDVIAGFRSHV